MLSPKTRALASVMALALTTACPAKTEEPKKAPPKAPAKAPEKTPAEAPPAAQANANPQCWAPFTTEGDKLAFEAGGKKFEGAGAQLNETSKDDDDQIVFGVVANIKENTPENMKNLDKILGIFKKAAAEAILVVGDLGENQAQIEDALGKLAESKLPVLAIMGNRESVKGFNAALAAASAKHPETVNMNKVRLVSFDDAAVISVPGYHNPVYVHSKDPCVYSAADLEALKPAVQAAKDKTIVLISHGPPLMDGTEALDRTLEQANVGSKSLADFIQATGIRIGVFANIHEAGGRATDLSGKTLIHQDKLSDALYLNPGPVDALPWKMNDGTESVGMAAILTVKGRQASFKIHRL